MQDDRSVDEFAHVDHTVREGGKKTKG
jgi:hypothetical protein